MSRSTLLYIGMLVLLGVGFEGIRRIGNTLTPPPHIAGQWSFSVPSSSSPSCPLLEFAEAGKGSLQVGQSGRYLILTFTDVHSTKVPARFVDGKLRGSGLSTAPCAAGTKVRVRGRLVGDHLELSLTRSQKEASAPVTSMLVLSATRPPGSGSRSPAAP
ncbi:MAG TPA: hypothetical protein VGX03_20400 [Candidatus Binatia bacterium]|nr:hypothetical protein [Candidatus Binatia bacterium]